MYNFQDYDEIELDFSDIIFIGMSPADELLKKLSGIEKPIKIQNLNQFVFKVIQGQKNSRNKNILLDRTDVLFS